MLRLLTVFSLLCAAPAAFSQAPTLSRGGGGLPGPVTWTVDAGPGAAGEIYGIVVATAEELSEPLPGVFLDVSLANLALTFSLPTLFGNLDGAGIANASVPLTNAALIGLTISAQALVGPDLNAPSNLVRTTLAAPGTFAETLESPPLPIVGGAATRNAAGDLVLAGGSGPLAQLYRQQLEEFELGGVSFGVGLLSQSTVLDDGRVLFTGGLDLGGQPTASAAVWDPATGQTTDLTMSSPRAGHAAAVLGDGRVLVTGGFDNVTIDLLAILSDPLQLLSLFDGVLSSTEVFDPATDSFAAGATMLEPRALHTATALSDGGVMVAGGLTLIPIVGLPTVSATAYVYSGNSGQFGLPSFFNGARLLHSAIGQPDGSVLLVGGLSVDLAAFIASGQIEDLAIGSRDDIVRYSEGIFFGGWDDVGTMAVKRAAAGLARTPDGAVLIAGGLDLGLSLALGELVFEITASAELYQNESVSSTGSMQSARALPLMAELDDGTVLVIGGGALDAEVYQP